jgi:hypothetical protein
LPAHPEFLEDFRAGIALGTLPAGVTATAPDDLAQRFAVYRNNVTVGLVDALAARFPVIQRLVGVEFFRAVAREFARSHPPRSPLLFLWGEAFPDFLAALPSLADYPYMADVARIEVARGVAYHAADAMPLPVSDLLAAA